MNIKGSFVFAKIIFHVQSTFQLHFQVDFRQETMIKIINIEIINKQTTNKRRKEEKEIAEKEEEEDQNTLKNTSLMNCSMA